MKRKGISNTQRTLGYLREQGFIVGIVERFITFAGNFGKRLDLFNFIDIIALDVKRKKIIAVQSCSGSSHAERREKILTECKKAFSAWTSCGGEVLIISWSKRKLFRGSKAVRWTVRVEKLDGN